MRKLTLLLFCGGMALVISESADAKGNTASHRSEPHAVHPDKQKAHQRAPAIVYSPAQRHHRYHREQ
jgi:hypothetical protein